MGDSLFDVIMVFLIGITGMWKGLSAGFIMQISPIYIFLLTALSSIIGVLILFFFGTKIRNYIINRRAKKGKSNKEKKALKLFDKYGHMGLGLFGTLAIGPPMTIILGLTIVKHQKAFLYWTIVGIVVWSMVLTIVGTISVETITRLT
jgi:membrane protein DedA with SNARE-associated domain